MWLSIIKLSQSYKQTFETFYNNICLFLILQILFGWANTIEFDLICPDMSQSHLRAVGICRRFPSSFYACLLDTNSNRSKESCNEAPDYSSPGNRLAYKMKQYIEIVLLCYCSLWTKI